LFSSFDIPFVPFAGLSFAAGGGAGAGDFDVPFDVEGVLVVDSFT